uniref:Uncharacterized protein n=1 Tax=Anguilla anguilla TaxID=7936 RepID=A0A0E9V2D8_ANGAN
MPISFQETELPLSPCTMKRRQCKPRPLFCLPVARVISLENDSVPHSMYVNS